MELSPHLQWGAINLLICLAFLVVFIAITLSLPMPTALISLIALWPATAFACISFAYFTKERYLKGSTLFGKPVLFDHTHHVFASVWMSPVLLCWKFHSHTSQVPTCIEICKGLYIGTSIDTFPLNTSTVVDTCAECNLNAEVTKTMRYVALPSLPMLAAKPEDLQEVGTWLCEQVSTSSPTNLSRLNTLSDSEGIGMRGRGAVYCFDRSLGMERAVVFVCVLLVMRKECDTVEDALKSIQAKVAITPPNHIQMASAQRAVELFQQTSTTAAAANEMIIV